MCVLLVAKMADGKTHSFKVGDGAFLLDGEPFVFRAAELHYPRIPRPYWRQRIQMCKALGMNAVCLYTFWNMHEQEPDVFDFDGQNDIRSFVEICEEEGMYVILRPGPYVCAEWEMGGLPWWLLRKDDIRLREDDPWFLERVAKFENALAGELRDLTVENGGPILMVQVENEYGSYGKNKEYVSAIRDIIRDCYGPDIVLFQCDWSSNFIDNGLDDLLWTLNFGTGADIDAQFRPLKSVRPDSPLMCSEFWSGWFDKWGASHETRPVEDMASGIAEMMEKNISFSLYMTHGGTNWGHWAGANSPGYAPDVTSYDYDAPISESGQPTIKFHALRDTIARRLSPDNTLPPVPELIGTTTVSPFDFTEFASLHDNLPASKNSAFVRPMEYFGQGFGSVLYRTTLPCVLAGAVLAVSEPHDFARIFVDGREIGRLDRRIGETSLVIKDSIPCGAVLDILVEATGRINFGRAIKDYKGITDRVYIASGDSERELDNWEIYLFPDDLDFYKSFDFRDIAAADRTSEGRLPAGVYKGVFNVERPADTFLRFDSWGKGLVYVNGYPLGRFWEIGPQQTLYTPGCWLHEGENEIIVFDILGPKSPASEGCMEPVLDGLVSSVNTQPDLMDLSEFRDVFSGSTQIGSSWQTIRFGELNVARYVCIEGIDAHDGGNEASIAELYLLDASGNDLSREQWRATASSSDLARNQTPDKAFDLQESTSWTTDASEHFPHRLIIDLGAEQEISALRLLHRMEPNTPGAIKTFKISVK